MRVREALVDRLYLVLEIVYEVVEWVPTVSAVVFWDLFGLPPPSDQVKVEQTSERDADG